MFYQVAEEIKQVKGVLSIRNKMKAVGKRSRESFLRKSGSLLPIIAHNHVHSLQQRSLRIIGKTKKTYVSAI
jgi:hypothetical protein